MPRTRWQSLPQLAPCGVQADISEQVESCCCPGQATPPPAVPHPSAEHTPLLCGTWVQQELFDRGLLRTPSLGTEESNSQIPATRPDIK